MCDTATCHELFHRYMNKVREHIDLVDRNLYGRLLAHSNHGIQNLVRHFLSGSQEIRKIMSDVLREWCPAKKTPTLEISHHGRFLADTEKLSRLILERFRDETGKLHPLIRKISGNQQHVA